MTQLDSQTESEIPYYFCRRLGTKMRPAIYVQAESISFGGRMLCSSCLGGNCYLTSPLEPCDLVAEAQADVQPWERATLAHNRPKEGPSTSANP